MPITCINWKTCEVHIQGLDMCDSKWYPSDWREVWQSEVGNLVLWMVDVQYDIVTSFYSMVLMMIVQVLTSIIAICCETFTNLAFTGPLVKHGTERKPGPELVEQLLKPDVVLIDVRTAEEFPGLLQL